MAEIQITPAGFTPVATDLPNQANPGAVNGGIATDNQRSDNVVQTVDDVIDLNADEGGASLAEQNAERNAAAQTTENSRDVSVRLDYDIEAQQLYVEFFDPRTEVTLTSVPRREAFTVDPRTIQDRLNETSGAETSAARTGDAVAQEIEQEAAQEIIVVAPPPPPPAVATPAPAPVEAAPVRNDAPPPPPPPEVVANTRAEILDDALPQQAENTAQVVQNGTQEQVAILENI